MTETNAINKSGTVYTTSKTVFISFFFTAFIAVTYGFGIYLFAIVVSEMKADIGFDYMVVGIITGSAQIAFLSAALLSGIVSPFIGAGRVILGSVIICGICLLCLGFVRNIWIIASMLIILGGCAASVWVPMVEVAGLFIPFKHRSKVLGLMSSGTSYGVFINGLIAPYFITYHHWSDIWIAVGAGTIMITILSVLALSRFGVFTMVPAGQVQPREPQGYFSGFRKDFMTFPNFIIWSMLFLNGLSCMPFQTYLAPYILDELNFPIELAGRIWSIIGFVGMGGGFAIGALSDKIGIRSALTLTYTFLGLAALMVVVHSSQYQLVIGAISFGLAFYAIFGLVPAYIAKTSTPAQSTVIFGIANVTLGFGSMLGNFIGGWSKTFLGTFYWTYIAILVVAILSVVITWLLPNERGVSASAEECNQYACEVKA
jgi:MFS family permease